MKRKLANIIFISLIIGCAGCSNTSNTTESTSVSTEVSSSTETSASIDTVITDSSVETSADTVGAKLVATFEKEMENGSSITNTIDALCKESGFDCGTMECQEGYLNGFSEEVTGFSSATMFSPYIGSIPFVGYIFETETPELLAETLLKLADPRWNICTEAEETVSKVYGNYVFFAMCPGEDF